MVIASIVFLIAWLGCGLTSAAYVYNYFQVTYPSLAKESEEGDFKFALSWSWLGPLALIADWSGGFCSKGLTFRRYK
jgi:hypothetical protein